MWPGGCLRGASQASSVLRSQRSDSVSSPARVIRRGALAALTVHRTELQMTAHLPAGDQSKEKEPELEK